MSHVLVSAGRTNTDLLHVASLTNTVSLFIQLTCWSPASPARDTIPLLLAAGKDCNLQSTPGLCRMGAVHEAASLLSVEAAPVILLSPDLWDPGIILFPPPNRGEGKVPQLHMLERTNWWMVLLDVLNQEWPGRALVVPTTGSGSRNCGLGLLGKLLLVRQQGQGWLVLRGGLAHCSKSSQLQSHGYWKRPKWEGKHCPCVLAG